MSYSEQVNNEINISKNYSCIGSLLEHFWKQWGTEYILSLQKFQKIVVNLTWSHRKRETL